VSDKERDILSLPARLGGLGIFNPSADCDTAHRNSLLLSEPLVDLVARQAHTFDPEDLREATKTIRAQLDCDQEQAHKEKFDQLYTVVSPMMQINLKVAREKGASSWVTALPLFDHETVLSKGEFIDAVYIRYGWSLPDLPLNCACGAPFDVQHALDCMIGGYRTIQHNEVRDVMAKIMKEAGFSGVETEPALQRLHGEHFERKSANTQDDARSDIKCTGFWRHMRSAYFDVKVISPFAKSYVRLSSANLYKLAENAKLREYGERIRNVEHADFNPLVFTTAGGMAPQCHLVIKRLATTLSERQGLPNSVVAGWLRCRLSFALLRTTLLCVRGTRARRYFLNDSNIEHSVSAAHIAY
jgi:hypothetical protein